MATAARAPILIAGPTASGKSALALQLAARHDGIVINADSMQVYRELRLLTARPSPEDEAQAPHRLYGHVGAGEAYSVARWLEDVARILAEAEASGLTPIVVGGTGLYFRALTAGLAPVPPIPEAVRGHWRAEARRLGATALHAALAVRDPVMAARLHPGDSQRVVRALEVIETTGRSLDFWQRQPGEPLIDVRRARCRLVLPPRSLLHERCDRRFDAMVAAGALDEVRHLLGLGIGAEMPVMRALGVRPLARHLEGSLALEAAVAEAKAETRRYVKRQETWIRKHMAGWPREAGAAADH